MRGVSLLGILLRKNVFLDIILIFAGVSLMAAGVRLIYEPLGLVTGGVSGFAIIVEYWTRSFINGGIPVWITNAVINVPLFIAGRYVKGKKYIIRSFFAVVIFTAELSLIPDISILGNDMLMGAVYGGVLSGAGLGIVMVRMSSTGGTDLLGAIIRHYIPQYSTASVIMYIDTVIIALGAMAFGVKNVMYAVIAVYITSKVMDTVVSGIRYSKLVIAITDNSDDISFQIMNKVNRGVTLVKAKGMYSGNDKDMLICAVPKREYIKVIRIISEKDERAFVMISDIREVLGEGFIGAKRFLD